MILKSLKVKNIRSYIEDEVSFSSGSQLLSGDIGSGKTTILLALEFALFGILRGTVPGESLLRHGSKEGFVDLKFSVNNKEVHIHRGLKKLRNRVLQSAGYLVIDGQKEDLTAVELKDRILTLLGYPKTLLTKSKSLVYRYTVYTPQEEMKKILFEDKDARLDTLRKVFDIEKYKRVKENASLYAKSLKLRCKRFEGIIHDLPEKEKKFTELSKEINNTKASLDSASDLLSKKEVELNKSKSKLELFEEKVKHFQDLKKQYQEMIINSKSVDENLKYFQIENTKLKSECELLEKEIVELDEDRLVKDSADVKEQIRELEKSIEKLQLKVQDFKTRHSASGEIQNKIQKLDNCPLCLQNVGEDHKTKILDIEGKKSGIYYSHILSCEDEISNNKKTLFNLKKQESELSRKEKDAAVNKIKIKNLKEKKENILKLESQISQNKKLQEELAVKEVELDKQLVNYTTLEPDYKQAKEEYSKIQEEHRTVLLQKNTFSRDFENFKRALQELQQDIERKKEAKKLLQKNQKLDHWLTNFFTNIILSIEKAVFTSIYQQFNELFQTWFNVLIENDSMNARIDDSFTPLVEQNGYDINLSHLSGGEKTCCALAYRLALNKVINDMMTSIRTRDLIILDEPTDGFSTQQLDKIRDVLEQVNLKQILLVSHEPQIESFVEQVIRVQKNNHISKVTQS